jgi:hypothetical protein
MEKIYLEIKDSFFYPEKWEDKIKKSNIPENFVLTEEQSGWRFK